MPKSPFIKTIIIVKEVHANIRGYSLLGKEFKLKEDTPRKDSGTTLDGYQMPGEYWVVSKEEYLRVVPEAAKIRGHLESNEILIPTFVARLNFRPCYIK